MKADDGSLHLHTEGDTLFAEGDIDLFQAPKFREAAQAHLAHHEMPIIDLRNVDFLDSAGLAVLLVLAREAKEQHKLLRVSASGSPRRVLRITGIDRVLHVEP